MTITQTTPAVGVKLTQALPEQEPILANLLELYAHDFSEFMDLKLGADGRFGYRHLSLYWQEEDRYPFLILANGHLAGFAFVRRGVALSNDEEVWDVAEFFVLRGFRRLGIGMKVAQQLWQQFPGKWEVRVAERNYKALEFWGRTITDFLGEKVEPIPFDKQGGEGWHVFAFESKHIP